MSFRLELNDANKSLRSEIFDDMYVIYYFVLRKHDRVWRDRVKEMLSDSLH